MQRLGPAGANRIKRSFTPLGPRGYTWQVSRIYDALQQADARRTTDQPEIPPESEVELSEDVSSLAALVKRLELRIERDLGGSKLETLEQLAALEISVGALEDRLEHELGEIALDGEVGDDRVPTTKGRVGAEFDAVRDELRVRVEAIDHAVDQAAALAASQPAELPPELTEQISQLDALAHALDERMRREFPVLRAEFDETIDKRVQSAVSQLVGRDQATRERLEARIDALRRDLDRGQRRSSILIGAVLLPFVVAYVC